MATSDRFTRWVHAVSRIGLIVTAPLLVYAVVRFYSSYAAQRSLGHREVCLDNLRVIGGGLKAYALDHCDRLPPAEKWEDLLLEDIGDPAVFLCPAAPREVQTGYAYYADLSRGSLVALADPADVPMVYDSPKGTWNARDSRPELPSPPRHGDRNHAAMADGSVRRLAPFDVWVEARFQGNGMGVTGDIRSLPSFSGPSVLYEAREPLALRTEHGIEWTAEPLPSGYVFRGPQGTGASTMILIDTSEGALPPLSPTATVQRRFEVTLAPEPGAFPLVATATEVTDAQQRVLRVMVPSQPNVLALITVPLDASESEIAEACLPLTALRWVHPPQR